MGFPEIPVLSDMVEQVGDRLREVLQRTIFVCVQHLLDTTGSLFEALIHLGARPDQIYIMGKYYSTSEGVRSRMSRLGVSVRDVQPPQRLGHYQDALSEGVDVLWKQVARLPAAYRPDHRIIVLDDGGRCIAAVPSRLHRPMKNIVGVEQTTSGLRLPVEIQCPVIEVASSAAKRLIEPPMIADAVAQRMRKFLLHRTRTVPLQVGVVGLGNIGRAVARMLRCEGHAVSVYDIAKLSIPEGTRPACDLGELFRTCSYIFGCTGVDILESPTAKLGTLQGAKTLASCSSGDREFRSLLIHAGKVGREANRNPLGTIRIRDERGPAEINILRGGFPFNFDGSHDSVPSHDIQLTRGLLLGALIQAVACQHLGGDGSHYREMLDPALQRYVVQSWTENRKPSQGFLSRIPDLDLFRDSNWVMGESGGIQNACSSIKDLFYLV